MQKPTTVFVIDPDGPTRDAICDVAKTMGLPCEGYACGKEFVDAYGHSQPGCVVLEVRVPGLSGLHIQGRLNAEGATIPLIFLAGKPSVSVAVRAMRGGAVNFLEKPFREEQLWDAIEEAIAIDEQRRLARRCQQQADKRFAALSLDEQQVFDMIGEGKSTSEIASHLNVTVRAIQLRRAKILRKLRLKSRHELARMASVSRNGEGPVGRQSELSQRLANV